MHTLMDNNILHYQQKNPRSTFVFILLKTFWGIRYLLFLLLINDYSKQYLSLVSILIFLIGGTIENY